MRIELESRYEDLKIIENLCESQRSMNEIDGESNEVRELVLVGRIVDYYEFVIFV